MVSLWEAIEKNTMVNMPKRREANAQTTFANVAEQISKPTAIPDVTKAMFLSRDRLILSLEAVQSGWGSPKNLR